MNIQAFDFSVDIMRCLLWQYDSAPSLRALLQSKQNWLDAQQEGFWNDWLVNVYDLTTANDFGLAVWAAILGVPLTMTPQPTDDGKDLWGFSSDEFNFDNGNFSSVGGALGLTTEEKRVILRLRFYQLVSKGTVPEVNAALADVFGPGHAYVQDSGAMAIDYVFTALSTQLQLALTQFDVLVRPAGVRSNIVILNEAEVFGFDRYHFNFENGNFDH